MKYCTKCGSECNDQALFCATCGNSFNVAPITDKSVFGLNVIGFLLPLVGLILYLVYHEKNPIKASAIGKSALLGFILRVLLSIILGVIAAFIIWRLRFKIYY